MVWKWDQSAGELSQDGKFICKGYSGLDVGKNNPALQDKIGMGPIPQGYWKINAPVDRPATVGPYAMALEPLPGTDTYGRSAFMIHGDSVKAPGQASHGCVILPRNVREMIWKSGDHLLEVVA